MSPRRRRDPHHALIHPRENQGPVRVLVVEDEPKMGRLLERGFAEEGHVAEVAPSGEEALRMTASTPYDAIVLDVMLPYLDGFATCRELRARGVSTPVLLLTAVDGFSNQLERVDVAAADYLAKPFSFAELLARLNALVRHVPSARPTPLLLDDLHPNPAEDRVLDGEVDLKLSAEERSRQ
jgi:two-component system, OmpR family, response regulator